MKSQSEKLEEAHNQGQEDAAEGVRTPPQSIAEIMGGATMEEAEEIREAYDQGQSHHDSGSGSSDGGHCFLTTACVRAAGLADDCDQLVVLREFRDTFVRNLPDGDALIGEYYRLSPQIVPKLSAEELRSIFVSVEQAVALIKRGEHHEAFAAYAALFSKLRDKYVTA